MGLRILLIGDDLNHLKTDGALLRSKGCRVYFCVNEGLVNKMIEETRPDVVYINTQFHDEHSSALYNTLIDNIQHVSLPVIYTLSENDVYLVNRKRTALKERRYMTSNNLLDAIRISFELPEVNRSKKRIPLFYPSYSSALSPHRA